MSKYVVVKLTTGEQILGTLVAKNSLGLIITNVISVKQLPMVKEGVLSEKVITSVYCNYSDDQVFEFDRKDVLFCKDLKQSLVSHYIRLIDEFYHDAPVEDEEIQTESVLADSSTLH